MKSIDGAIDVYVAGTPPGVYVDDHVIDFAIDG